MGLEELVRWLNANAGTAQVIGSVLAVCLSGAGWLLWQTYSSQRSGQSHRRATIASPAGSVLDRIRAERKMRVAVLDYLPLMGFEKDGEDFKGVGVYPRILSRIAGINGFKIDWYPINWSDIVTVLEKDRIDVVASIFWTEKRSEQAVFCGKMHRVGVTALVKAGEDRIQTHEDLSRPDILIGVVRGEIGWEYAVDTLKLEFDPRLKVQDEINISRSVEMLEKGMVHVILADALSCWSAVQRSIASGSGVKQIFAADALYVCDNGFMIKRGDERFQKWLDSQVRALRHDPVLEGAELADLAGLEGIVRRREP